MSSTSTLDGGQTPATLPHPPVPGSPPQEPGRRLLSRLDVFLSEPLRKATPDEVGRCRLLVCIILGLMFINAVTLLYIPYSPQPLNHFTAATFALTMNTFALVLLRRRSRSELSGMIVCTSVAVAFTFACLNSSYPYSAAHTSAALVPALAVYLVGARQGFVLSALMSVVVGIIHPLRYADAFIPQGFTPVRMADTFAALCIMAIWAVSWLHANSREQAHQAREKALSTLRESEHKLQSLIENTDDHVCSLDPEGRLIIGNSAMRQSFCERYGHEPMPGEYLTEHPLARQMIRERVTRTLAGENVHMEDSQVRGGRLRTMDISFKPIFTSEGKALGVTLFGRDITERKDAEAKLGEMHRSLMDVSRQAGMAEVATGLLHNVGNTLNSVNVSANLVVERLKHSRLAGLTRAADMLRAHQGELGTFLTTHPQGQRLPAYVIALAEQLAEEQRAILAEQHTLTEGLDHVKSIVSMQQEHARLSAMEEVLSVPRLINDALRLHSLSFERSGIELRREYAEVPSILVDRHKLLQILLNLLSNARHALLDSHRKDKRVTIRIAPGSPDRLRIQVSDNGKGISPENLGRIFTQGFTTKKDGHGFGLHISALAATEMAGSLSVESAGVDQGATFTIDLPMRDKDPPN